MVFKNIYLFGKILFFYSYRRKIIDKQHFPYIFNGPFLYFWGVTLMSFNQLSLISSWVQILYCMYVTSLSISPQHLLTICIYPIFLSPFRYFGFASVNLGTGPSQYKKIDRFSRDYADVPHVRNVHQNVSVRLLVQFAYNIVTFVKKYLMGCTSVCFFIDYTDRCVLRDSKLYHNYHFIINIDIFCLLMLLSNITWGTSSCTKHLNRFVNNSDTHSKVSWTIK